MYNYKLVFQVLTNNFQYFHTYGVLSICHYCFRDIIHHQLVKQICIDYCIDNVQSESNYVYKYMNNEDILFLL
ncbi:'078R [Invertebrate iridescent virus Kaz2018]|nr:'078R [Invertebrate iridescent virus Kaz2018]